MSPSTDKQILTVNKLILLRFMCKMDIPLTSLHISQFFLERNMMNYFDIQQCIGDLLYSKLIQYSNDAKKLYTITQNGRNADKFFSYKIPENIVKTIDKHVDQYREEVKKQTQIYSTYKKVKDKEYIVTCKVMENNIELMGLRLNVVSREQAKLICTRWESNATHIYQEVIKNLLSNN
ncbi:MAG: DUF4364 family protein [Mahellales bacterium]|jgi:hypothetical protein